MSASIRLVARSLVALGAAIAAPAALAQAKDADAPALMRSYGCTICHDTTETKAGPSWVDIAAHYRGNPKATKILTDVVRKGQHGGGPWPMPPLPEVTESDARAIVRYILAQKP